MGTTEWYFLTVGSKQKVLERLLEKE